MDSALQALELERTTAVVRGKAITAKAVAENRGLTDAENTEVEALLATAQAKTEEIAAHQKAVKATAELRGAIVGARASWKALASALKESGRGAIRLKDVTISYDDEVRARVEPGVSEGEGVAYDTRYIANVFSSTDPGGALSVTDFRVVSRAIEESGFGSGEFGDIERDPTSTDEKAELAVEIDSFTEDMRQLAIMVRGVPNALFASEAALSGVLKTQMGRALAAALDAHVLGVIQTAIDGGDIESGGTGSSPEELLRQGISAMQLKGIQPKVAVLNPEDAETVDLHTAVDSITRFPFGISIVVSPDVQAGTVLVLNPEELGHLYKGGLDAASDPYTGFSRNTTDLRAEFNTLFVLRNPDAAFAADGSGGS